MLRSAVRPPIIPTLLTLAAAAASACGAGTDSETSPSAPDARSCSPGFATTVVSVAYGTGAGYGQARMPDVALGPPRGGGDSAGGTDVVSLGIGGEIVFGFDGVEIVDGPGPDFAVFENAFFAGGDPTKVFAEPGEVSVSQDGQTWVAFACQTVAPFDGCSGTHPVLSSPDNNVSAFDPEHAGGDWFDLASVGVQRAKYVRVRDVSSSGAAGSAGYDFDALAVRNVACSE